MVYYLRHNLIIIMGAGASTQPAVGVAVNPRVEYASKIAHSEGKTHLIDAPVLVDLPHGTIRYRYVDKQHHQPVTNDSTLTLQQGEGPHVGSRDLENKKGYFFHTKFSDYSTEANQANLEADYKFKYVFKGPRVAKNKRLYYVTGQKMHTSEDAASYASGLNTPVWPNIRMEPKHVYYTLEFLMEDSVSVNDSTDISEQINSSAPILMNVNGSDSIESLKEKVSMHILEPTVHIHIFYQAHEIRPGTNISGLLSNTIMHEGVNVKLLKLSN